MTDFVFPADKYGLAKTDHSRWRLRVDELGKQTWDYLRDDDHLKRDPPSNFTLYQLNLPGFNAPKLAVPKTARDAAANAFRFLSLLQTPEGTFPCQYTGPMFMLIGYVVVKYFSGLPFSEEERIEISRYIVNRAHPVDGGWGLHTYDKSTVFGTSINYVILRILGMDRDHPAAVKARNTLHAMGGAVGNPHWGKAYLALLNLFKWEGVNPMPPELFLLPKWLPIHPSKWWVHTRAIYLPLGYLSANKVQMKVNPLLAQLREELYLVDYDSIDFPRNRNKVCGIDLYYPHTWLLDTANDLIIAYQNYFRTESILKRSNERVVELVLADLKNTDNLAIAPVSNALNALVVYIEKGKESPEFQRFIFRWPDFLFMTPDGLAMNGTNGVQVWDAAFILQYCIVAGLANKPEFKSVIERSYKFLVRSQFVEDTVAGSFRDHRVGAWPFSTQTQGFTVSDCTAEALKAIIMVQNIPQFGYLKKEISKDRLFQAVDILLSMQNRSHNKNFGSFASYEKIKAPGFVELLNPAEVFENIMVEFPYVECTDSVVLGLYYFRKHFDYRQEEVDRTIKDAVDYILSHQDEDGSWYGSWGVCYTYAGMFAIEALQCLGYNYDNSEVVQKACKFIVDRQEDDGGWSENFRVSVLTTELFLIHG